MPNSIFKEVTFTPNIFEKEVLFSNERKFERLLNILDNLAENGLIVGVFSDWLKVVNENIVQFSEFEKNEIQEVLKFLDNRQRIVNCINSKCENNDEKCWVEQALKLNEYRNFEFIFALQQHIKIRCFEQIDRQTIRELQNKGATVVPQSKENMEKLLAPILAYAEIVKVFDPYCNLLEDRYQNALRIISQTLGFRHGQKKSAIFEIHTSNKVLKVLNENRMINFKKLDDYPKIIAQFEQKYGHQIKIFVWEDKKYKWHDRWIITNQCAITLGKGTDISEWTDSTWGILDYNQIPNIERKFQANRDEFNLIATVDNNGYKKENRPLQNNELKTELEVELDRNEALKKIEEKDQRRIEKIANSKNFKR